MMDKLISYYGFSRTPFGRDLAPSKLHRHASPKSTGVVPTILLEHAENQRWMLFRSHSA